MTVIGAVAPVSAMRTWFFVLLAAAEMISGRARARLAEPAREDNGVRGQCPQQRRRHAGSRLAAAAGRERRRGGRRRDGALLRYVAKPVVNLFPGHQFADFRAMDDIVRGSGLDWTIVRPPRLTWKPFTGRYRTSRGQNVRGGRRELRRRVRRGQAAAGQLPSVPAV